MADFTIDPPPANFTIHPPSGGFSIAPPPAPAGLVPAVKKPDGNVVVGQPGDQHKDIPTIAPADRHGFTIEAPGASKSQPFLNRSQAGQAAQRAGLDVPDNLHTTDLNQAKPTFETKAIDFLKGLNPFSAENVAGNKKLMSDSSQYSHELAQAQMKYLATGDTTALDAVDAKWGKMSDPNNPSAKVATGIAMGASGPTAEVANTAAHAAQTVTDMNVGRTGRQQPLGRTIQSLVSPATVDRSAQRGADLVRQGLGAATRSSATTAARTDPMARAIEPHVAAFDQWQRQTPQQRATQPVPQLARFYDYVEGRSTGAARPTDPTLARLADVTRQEMQQRQAHYQASPRTMNAGVVEDYFSHQWEQTPQQVGQAYARSQGSPLQGSGRNLRARSIPTISDGLAQGLTLRDPNPITAMQTYVNNMDRYLAWDDITAAARSQRDARYFLPGSPAIPADWVPLQGRLGQRQTPAGSMQLYGPRGFATVYNNAISRGLDNLEHPNVAAVYDATRKTLNTVTAAKLALSGYHALAVTTAAISSDVARAFRQGDRGDAWSAAKTLAKAPLGFATAVRAGGRVRDEYLGAGTHGMGREADLMTHANMRVDGRDPNFYTSSTDGSYVSAYRRGSIGREIRSAFTNATGRVTPGSVAHGMANTVARGVDTIMAPLFDYYVPRLKAGIAQKDIADWLRANPRANPAEQRAYARTVSDSMDNRFGEMVQDNLFWNKVGKQIAQTLMLSPGWTVGTIRELGGGAMDLARGRGMTQKSSYALALPVTVAAASSIIQYLTTGKHPDAQTLMGAPLTGGNLQGTPERMQLPSEWKDIVGYLHDPGAEAAAKINPGLTAVGELATNKDWRGLPIADPSSGLLSNERIGAYGKQILSDVSPISIEQLGKGAKKGSAIGPAATLLGVREAPSYLEDPARSQSIQDRLNRKAMKAKVRADAKDKAKREP